jgi:uncharacterized GH25 family protein
MNTTLRLAARQHTAARHSTQRALAGLALACAALAGPAHAHRSWLLPSATVVTGNEPLVSVDAAVSEDLFEFDTVALKLEGLVITAPDGSTVTAENLNSARHRSSFDVKLSKPGTYRIANYAETVAASYKLGSEAKRWRGSAQAYATFAKELPADAQDVQATRLQNRVETFITNDRPGEPAFKPAGTGLELEPLTAPTDLSVGDTSRFRLLLDGQPAAGADVTILRGGNRYRYKLGELALKTDAQGLFSVQWPEAGRYLVTTSHGRRTGPAEAAPRAAARAPADVAALPRRASYSVTLEVLPQ